jgi:hypothetical protein
MPVAGADNPWHPFWSADGRFVAYSPITGGRMRRADILGGAPLTVAEAASGFGAWNAQGTIVFAVDGQSALSRVDQPGGPVTPLTELDAAAGESGHMWPLFLDDGRRFIFLARNADTMKSALVLSSLDRPRERW